MTQIKISIKLKIKIKMENFNYLWIAHICIDISKIWNTFY
jgi:hypothetical protein